MKKQQLVDKFLFKDNEDILCVAHQKIKILGWLFTNIIIMGIVLGGIGVFLFVDIVKVITEFISTNAYIKYIYFGIVGVWTLIFLIKLTVKLSKYKAYTAVLTNKRLLLIRGQSITTILFSAIVGVGMRNDEDEEYVGRASISVQTNATIYDLKNMKGGNKLAGLLLRLLFGDTIIMEVVKSGERQTLSIMDNVAEVKQDNKLLKKETENIVEAKETKEAPNAKPIEIKQEANKTKKSK